MKRADDATARLRFVGLARASDRLVRDQRDDRVDRGVDALDLIQVRGYDVPGRKILRADQPREVDGAESADVGCHAYGTANAAPYVRECPMRGALPMAPLKRRPT